MSQANYNALCEEIKKKKLDLIEEEKNANLKMEEFTNRLNQLEFDRVDLQKRLKEQEKDASICVAKFNEIRRSSRSNNLISSMSDNLKKTLIVSIFFGFINLNCNFS